MSCLRTVKAYRGTGDAQHYGDRSSLPSSTPLSADALPSEDRIPEAGIRGPGDATSPTPASRSSRWPGCLSKKYAAERAALIDPSQANCDVATPGDPPRRLRGHDLPLGGRSRRKHRLADPESLQWLRVRNLRGRHGLPLCTIGALCSPWTRSTPTPWHLGSARFTPSFRLSWKRGACTRVRDHGRLNQAQAHAQFVSNLVDHGMNIQAALEAPRFTQEQFGGCEVTIESRVPAEDAAGLAGKGPQAGSARRVRHGRGRRPRRDA